MASSRILFKQGKFLNYCGQLIHFLDENKIRYASNFDGLVYNFKINAEKIMTLDNLNFSAPEPIIFFMRLEYNKFFAKYNKKDYLVFDNYHIMTKKFKKEVLKIT